MLILWPMNEIFAEFNSTILLVIKGLAVGILASAPMGPVGILCIQRTIQKGRIYGLATGAGAALSDFIYALLTGLGMGAVMTFVESERNLFWLKLVGSVMLFAFGLYMFFSDPRKGFRPASGNRGTLVSNFSTAFLITLSNPLIVFLFIAVFNMLTFVVPSNPVGMLAGYASIIGGAMLWWLGLTYVLNHARNSFGPRGVRRLNRTIGTVVLIVSVAYALSTLLHLNLTFY